MLKKIYSLLVICSFMFMLSGCTALVGAAISAAAGYGIYQATRK